MIPGGLNLRRGPGLEHAVVRVLRRGERVWVRASLDGWRRVVTAAGSGFVAARYLRYDGVARGDAARGDAASGRSYRVRRGETLRGIARRLGVPWRELQAANAIADPDVIAAGRVLRVPAALVVPVATVSVLDPLPSAGRAVLTSSSADGHHRPYGGSHSADLDVSTAASPGQPVRFNIACAVAEVRGVVEQVALACRSRPGDGDEAAQLASGGRRLVLRIERRDGGSWLPTGARLLYAHLDPVLVAVGAVVPPGGELGKLGPAGRPAGVEYDSACARRSHVHIEGWRGEWVARAGVRPGAGELMRLTI